MNIDYKKLALIILVIAATVALIFLIYFLFYKPITSTFNGGADERQKTTSGTLSPAGPAGTDGSSSGGSNETGTQGNNQSEGQILPTENAENSKLKKLTDFPAYFSSPSDNGLVYYNYSDGKFYKILPDGSISLLSDKVFHNVSNIVWSNGKNKAILQYPDGSNIIYDFKQDKQITLQKHWSDFTFSPSDQQIAFKSFGIDPENRFLAIGDTNGSNLKILESIGGVENKFSVNWSPNNSMVANFIESNGMDRSEIYFIGQNNENFKSMLVQGRGFEGVWTPDGTAMVYSTYDTSDYIPQLWISGAGPENIGVGRNVLGINTWIDKCSFSGNTTLYCAVPQQMPTGSALEPSLTLGISDNIYKIDLQTGNKQLITNSNHTINKIFPLNNGNDLLFTDAFTGEIYRIEN